MDRLTIIAALFVVLVTLTEASLYRTIVISTSEIDDIVENHYGVGGGGRCREQLRWMRLDGCKRFLQPGRQFDIVWRKSLLQQCCGEIRQLSKDCRCEAIEQTMHQITGPCGPYYCGWMEEMMEKVQQLPNMCGIGPRYCDIHGGGY